MITSASNCSHITWHFFGTPPTPTRLNCRVESCRVLNSQLVHDVFGRLPTGEYTPSDTIQLDSTCSVFNFYTKSAGSRHELDANSMYTAARRDSTRQLELVASAPAVCIGLQVTTETF